MEKGACLNFFHDRKGSTFTEALSKISSMFSRYVMQATYVILNVLVATLKNVKRNR